MTVSVTDNLYFPLNLCLPDKPSLVCGQICEDVTAVLWPLCLTDSVISEVNTPRSVSHNKVTCKIHSASGFSSVHLELLQLWKPLVGSSPPLFLACLLLLRTSEPRFSRVQGWVQAERWGERRM